MSFVRRRLRAEAQEKDDTFSRNEIAKGSPTRNKRAGKVRRHIMYKFGILDEDHWNSAHGTRWSFVSDFYAIVQVETAWRWPSVRWVSAVFTQLFSRLLIPFQCSLCPCVGAVLWPACRLGFFLSLCSGFYHAQIEVQHLSGDCHYSAFRLHTDELFFSSRSSGARIVVKGIAALDSSQCGSKIPAPL
jgi:hypothetical protein